MGGALARAAADFNLRRPMIIDGPVKIHAPVKSIGRRSTEVDGSVQNVQFVTAPVLVN
jgi:hypothetical protein